MCLIAIVNIVYLYNYRVASDSSWLNVFYCLYYRSNKNFILYIIISYPICKSISSVWNLILVDPTPIKNLNISEVESVFDNKLDSGEICH